MSDYTLHLGDAREKLATMPDASIDAVVTDPPYGLSREPDMAEVLRHWLAGDTYAHGSGGFMGKSWDSFVPGPEYWREVYRVMKPGAHLLAFGGTRTWDLLSLAIRLAGFENRDTISHEGPPALRWYQGQGFPKSLDVGKAIDAAAGAERAVVGTWKPTGTARPSVGHKGHHAGKTSAATPDTYKPINGMLPITAPATAAAKQWDGWGSALKPAWEVILVFRKPLAKGLGIAANVQQFGTGALNIDATRVGTDSIKSRKDGGFGANFSDDNWKPPPLSPYQQHAGRWPANVVFQHAPGCELVGTKRVKGSAPHGPNAGKNRGALGGFSQGHMRLKVGEHTDADGCEEVEHWQCEENCPVRELDAQSGDRPSSGRYGESGSGAPGSFFVGLAIKRGPTYFDTGGASRFFYVSKASAAERTMGLAPGERNINPCVKPITLLRYLSRLICPPGGTVLDCFMGSGSTGCACVAEGFRFIGIERESEYLDIARQRIDAVPRPLPLEQAI